MTMQREDGEDEEASEAMLVSSVAGRVERVSKLVSVRPVKSRYSGDVGDLVVGRIVAIESKRWKVDIRGWKDAALQLSSVNLPGGVQRIRTYEDQLQMRTLYTENDLISAEIQNIKPDGLVSLHTRSLKYGKLENGVLICVPAALVKRLPQHNVTLPWEIDVLLGKNGMIWITRTIPEDWKIKEGQGAVRSLKNFFMLLFMLSLITVRSICAGYRR
jgi:exosome complex component RRP4